MAADEIEWTEEMGARIRSLRKGKAWTQGELAAAAAPLDEQYLSKIERGVKAPSPKLLKRIAASLGTSDDALRGRTATVHQLDDFRQLDPKEQVRRSPQYLAAPREVQVAFDRDDKLTHAPDTAKLTVRVYGRRLEELWADFDAGVLPKPEDIAEGTKQRAVHDPDAPPKKR